MKKHLVLLVLLLISFNATAEWKIALQVPEFEVYIDPSKIKKNIDNGAGEKATSAWALHNYKELRALKNGVKYRSAIVKSLYDCQNDRMIYQEFIAYPEPLGKGAIIFSDDINPTLQQWKYLKPRSIGKAELEFVCKQ